jgi:acetolactate synthase-1/2/3 large subunit
MQQSRTRAIAALKGTRTCTFSTSAVRTQSTPLTRPAQAAATKIVKEDVRTQSTAAAASQSQSQSRARPAPAFNREDYGSVQPLKPYRAPEMDHSFVGMTGGQIFHEMMLRQGVKHICTFPVSAEQREEKRGDEARRDADKDTTVLTR